MALGMTQLLTEMSRRNISWGQRRPVRRADKLTTFICRLSWNLGASTFWNSQGLSRPVMELPPLPFTFRNPTVFLSSDKEVPLIWRVYQVTCFLVWTRQQSGFSKVVFR